MQVQPGTVHVYILWFILFDKHPTLSTSGSGTRQIVVM